VPANAAIVNSAAVARISCSRTVASAWQRKTDRRLPLEHRAEVWRDEGLVVRVGADPK